MKNFFDVAHAHSKPSNKNAALAVSGGLSYSPSVKGHEDFDLPPEYWHLNELPVLPEIELEWIVRHSAVYGLKNFRLEVLGLAKNAPKKLNKYHRYTCVCSCGMFCLRTEKQMRSGKYQCCGVCQRNKDRKLADYYASTGVYLDVAEVWQRMGGA
jgi:hypothetical protein